MRDVQPNARKTDESNVTTTLAEDLHITGTMTFKSSLMIEGTLDGEIVSEGLLIIGPTAKVNAAITTKNLISHGKITGDVTASEQVVLKGSAVQTGNITTPYIIVESGSVFNGSCVMKREAPAESLKPEPAGEESTSGTEGARPHDAVALPQEQAVSSVQEERAGQETAVSEEYSALPAGEAVRAGEDVVSTEEEPEEQAEKTDEGSWWQGEQRTRERTSRSPKEPKKFLF